MAESEKDLGEKLQHEGWSDIKEKKRSCTDCLLLLLLVACWGAMTLLGFVALGWIPDERLPAGDPNRLLSPMDYNGRICGIDSAVSSKPYAYYLLDETSVCVSDCPTTTNVNLFHCKDDQDTADPAVGHSRVTENNCMYYVKTKEVLKRCFPDGVSGTYTANDGTTVDVSEYGTGDTPGWFTTFLQDLYDNSGIIFGIGIGVSIVISFVYLILLRVPGFLSLIIWSILLSVLLLIFVGAYLLFDLSEQYKEDDAYDDSQALAMEVVSYIVFVIGALYLCLLLVMRERVQLAIAVVKEAARALSSMPALLGLPLVQAVGLILFMLPWMVYAIYLASSGDIVTISAIDSSGNSYNYKQFEYSTNTQYAFLYMLFCWFWTSQFIIAYGQMAIAMAFVAWYFTHEKGNVGTGTVLWSVKTVTWYHMGTVAFGSLVIAIVKTIRAVLEYIRRKAEKSGNRFLVALMACLQCCMWCLEKFLQFLNKNAYIQTAIYGYSFCYACASAFKLILRNIMRVAAVSMVGDFVLVLGKVFISVFTTFIAYLALVNSGNDLNGFILPLLFVLLLAYFVASMFTEIFGMGISTILQCFIADEEMFEPEKRFAEGGLRSTMQITAQKAAAGKVAPEVDAQDGGATATAGTVVEKAPQVSVKSSQGDGDVLL